MTNIVVNPGAELGGLGWSLQPSGWLIRSILPRSGSQDFLNDKTSPVSMSQTLNFVVGANYSVSFWARGDSAHDVNLTLAIDGQQLISTTNVANDFIKYSFSENYVPANTIEILEIIGYQASSSNFIVVDDIFVDGPVSTASPSSQPSVQPTSLPSSQPTSFPSAVPSNMPSGQPSSEPSSQPTSQPTLQPIGYPSMQPSAQPTSQPSSIPSVQPSSQPTSQPTLQPIGYPSMQPSELTPKIRTTY